VFVRQRSVRRADHSSRGVLPTVVCHCVWSRNLKNEEAKTRKWVVNASRIIIKIIPPLFHIHSPTSFSYQKDKRAKSRDFPKNNVLSEIGELWLEKELYIFYVATWLIELGFI
jgi:hypothetical protein